MFTFFTQGRCFGGEGWSQHLTDTELLELHLEHCEASNKGYHCWTNHQEMRVLQAHKLGVQHRQFPVPLGVHFVQAAIPRARLRTTQPQKRLSDPAEPQCCLLGFSMSPGAREAEARSPWSWN